MTDEIIKAHNAKRIAENEALAIAAELDEANALLALHRRFHDKVGCPGNNDCYVCAAELKKCEQELLEHGDPLSGGDWQEMQNVRAALQLCARLLERFESASHPICPDPQCGEPDGEHVPDCAYLKYINAATAAA